MWELVIVLLFSDGTLSDEMVASRLLPSKEECMSFAQAKIVPELLNVIRADESVKNAGYTCVKSKRVDL